MHNLYLRSKSYFLASCALGVRVRCRRHRRLSKNVPLSQSPPYLPFVHGSAPLSKATRARVSKAWRRGSLRKKVCVDSAGLVQATVQIPKPHPSIRRRPSFISLPSSISLSPSVLPRLGQLARVTLIVFVSASLPLCLPVCN